MLGTGTACSVVAGLPTTETCNGVDDDCNGTVDNGPTSTCAAPIDLGTINAGGSSTRTDFIPAPAGWSSGTSSASAQRGREPARHGHAADQPLRLGLLRF